MLVFDVSGSMAADDMQPTRMEAAKAAARAFVEQQQPGVLLGVVAFSDNGFAAQAPTKDRDAVLDAIARLQPQRGTSLAHGVVAAIDTLAADPETNFYSNLTPTPAPTPTPVPGGTYTSAAIVLFTDGENNVSPDPLEAAQIAADRGVRIYTVGIGSAAGAVLNIDGFSVHTRLDEALLHQMADLTGGAYSNAESAEDLRAVVDNLTPQWVVKPDDTEITSLFAGASIILLIGGAFSLLWFGRLP
jgi:Ca-activated chloride channel family protein